MMNATLFAIILRILVLIIMGIGFMRGTVGLKFTLVRFIFFLLAIGLSLTFMELIANTLSANKFIMGKSLTDLFIQLVNSNSFLSNIYSNSPRIKEVIDQLPSVLCQALSFTIALMVFSFVCNIAYSFVKYFILKNIDWFDCGKTKEEKGKKGVSTRSKVFGGLMGMIFAFVVLVTILLPLSGVIKTVGNVISVSDTVSASEDDNESLGEQIFGDDFAIIKQYIDTYNNSSIGIISGIGNMDIAFVKKITVVEIDGKKVNLIDNVKNMQTIYEDILYLTNFKLQYKDVSDLDNLDLSKVKNIVNYLFDNELFDSLFDEVSIQILDYVKTSTKLPSDTKQYVEKIYNEMQKGTSPKVFIKNEVSNLIDVCQILLDSHIAIDISNFISKPNESAKSTEEIFDKLLTTTDNGKSYLNNAVTKFKDSKTLNITSCFVFNKILNALEQKIIAQLPDDGLSAGFLGKVNLDTDVKFEQIANVIDKAIVLWNNFSIIDLKSEDLVYDALTKKTKDNLNLLPTLLNGLKDVLNDVINLDILNYELYTDSDVTILDKLCYYLPKANVYNFINYEFVQDEGIFNDEVAMLNASLDLFYNSTYYTDICLESFDKKTLNKTILSFLNETTNSTKNSKIIIENLLSTKLFRNIEKQFLNILFNNINESLKVFLNTNQNLPKIVLTNLYTDAEKTKISNCMEDMIAYYDTILTEDEKELKYAIVESDYSCLGNILDQLRDIEMFKNNNVGDGYYKSLMLELDEYFSEYLNFEVATENTFSWLTTMNQYGTILNELLNYELIDENNDTIILFDIFTKTSDMPISTACSQIGALNLAAFYLELKNCELFNPISEIMLNAISDLA